MTVFLYRASLRCPLFFCPIVILIILVMALYFGWYYLQVPCMARGRRAGLLRAGPRVRALCPGSKRSTTHGCVSATDMAVLKGRFGDADADITLPLGGIA